MVGHPVSYGLWLRLPLVVDAFLLGSGMAEVLLLSADSQNAHRAGVAVLFDHWTSFRPHHKRPPHLAAALSYCWAVDWRISPALGVGLDR